MRAMILEQAGRPLVERHVPTPIAGAGQLLVQVNACGVCRTDLHVVDSELPNPTLPLIPGHEVVGRVAAVGAGVEDWSLGDRVGIPWLASTCGHCEYCRRDQENLCTGACFTGYTWNGGYAEFAVADARYCLRIPDRYSDQEAAPLLCAGLIGYRCLRKAGNAPRLGLYGFGAAAHLIAQIAQTQGRTVLAFTRPGDSAARQFARSFGATWTGASTDPPPQPLDAAILFAPAGELVPAALRAVKPGGCVVCGGIHMSDIPSFPYALLWEERTVTSVANLTRRDGREFMELAAASPLRVTIQEYPLIAANEALADLRAGRLSGAAVLRP